VPPERVERKLAAILAADVAGYSRLIGVDEEGTLQRLKAHRKELIDPKIAEHQGRIVKLMGDGILIEFPSAVAALRCAVDIQRAMNKSNASTAKDRRIEFRIGLHQGDIVVEDGDILGDGVNVAARLEGLAEPGGICVSQRVHEDAVGRVDAIFEDIGEQQLKNIARPVRVYEVRRDRTQAEEKASLAQPDKASVAFTYKGRAVGKGNPGVKFVYMIGGAIFALIALTIAAAVHYWLLMRPLSTSIGAATTTLLLIVGGVLGAWSGLMLEASRRRKRL
jgi:adenylate cyclase